MKNIEIKGILNLQEPIVLATQDRLSFTPATVRLPSGTTLRITPVLPKKQLLERYSERKSEDNWYVNHPVRQLSLRIRTDIAADDLARLNGVHSDKRTFHAGGHDYQYAEELAKRVGTDVISGVNQLLRHVRDTFGQEWLDLLDQVEAHDNLFWNIRAQWRLADGKWQRFLPIPPGINLRGVVIGAADQYLELADWRQVRLALKHQQEPSLAYSMLADARWRYRTGDTSMAIAQLNAAIERAAHEFVDAEIRGTVPEPTREATLRQSYDRLLSDWVLPLADRAGIDLRSNEWPVIQEIKKLRIAALHPGRILPPIDPPTFSGLRNAASSAIAKLLRLPPPKVPPYLVADSAGGTGGRK